MSPVRPLAVVVLGLSLGACQTLSSLTGAAPTPPAPTAAVPATPVAGPARPAPQGGVRAADGLQGLDAARLLSLWGEPRLRRREEGAELWTWRVTGSGCTLLVYLYPGPDGGLAVMRGEALPGGADDGAIAACARANRLPALQPVG